MGKKGVYPPALKKYWATHKRGSGKSKRKRRSSTTTSKTRRVGAKIVGPLGFKGLLFGIVVLTVAKYLARKFLPIPPGYMQGAAMVGASLVPVGGARILRPAGVIDLASEFAVDLIRPGGIYTVPGLGAGGQGGYDF